jgi:amino acid transporter
MEGEEIDENIGVDGDFPAPESLSNREETVKKQVGFVHVFLLGKIVQFPSDFFLFFCILGLTMKLGGCAIKWSYGLQLGFPIFSLFIFIYGFGYLMRGLCMAEMISVMAFDGGYYGYARVLMGPFGGYMVGCFGLAESIFYFSMFPLRIIQFFEMVFDIDHNYRLYLVGVLYIFFFLSFIGIQYRFWDFILINSIIVILLFIIFLFGSIPAMDFDRYALLQEDNSTKHVQVQASPLSVLFFMGFDLISLAGGEVRNVSI